MTRNERDEKITELTIKNEGLQNRLTQWDIITVSRNPLVAAISRKSRLLTKDIEDQMVSELANIKPLDTVIRMASDNPETRALATQIKDVFSRGGFPITHVFTGPQKTWRGAEFTTGVEFTMKDLPEPKLANVLYGLLAYVGAKVEYTAGQNFEAGLVITVGDQ